MRAAQTQQMPDLPAWARGLAQTAPGPWLLWWPHDPTCWITSQITPPCGTDDAATTDDAGFSFPAPIFLTGWAGHDPIFTRLLSRLASDGIPFHHRIEDARGQGWFLEALAPDGPQPRYHQQPCLIWFRADHASLTPPPPLPEQPPVRNIDPDHPVLDHLPVGVALLDDGLRITSANRIFWQMMATPRPVPLSPPIGFMRLLQDRRDYYILPPGSAFGRFVDDLMAWLQRADEAPLELPLANDRILRATAFARHGTGPMLRLEDITDALDMARSLAALGAVQRQTLEYLREGIMVIGADGRTRYHNNALTDMLGHPAQDMPGAGTLLADWLTLWTPLLATDNDLALADWLALPPPGQQSWHLVDGRTLEARMARLPDGALLVSWTDITVHRQLAEKLARRAAREAEIHRIKQDLWAGMACRLRTPLTSIVGYGEAMQAGYFGPVVASGTQALNHIITAGQELQTIIDHMIDVAALEAGIDRLDLALFDLGALLEQVRQDLHNLCQQHQRILVLRRPDHECPILGDKKRLHSLFFDLLSDLLSRPAHAPQLVVRLVMTDAGWAVFAEGDDPEDPPHKPGSDLAHTLLALHGGTLESVTSPQDGWRIHLPAGARGEMEQPEHHASTV